MKQTINFDQFYNSFQVFRPDNFSRAGLKALFDYLEEYERNTETEIELDVIALCCEYTEYKHSKETDSMGSFARDYPDLPNQVYNKLNLDLDHLREHTTVIRVGKSDGFIIQQF